jgi:PTS system N-acetylgalactosamine-specific IIA component
MIGFIITGHNNIASGILGAAEMIMGVQDNIEVVNFEINDDVDILSKKIKQSVSKFDTDSGIIIFTDLAGGSPFNRSMLMIAENANCNIHVISGTNLPILIEALNIRNYITDINQIVNEIMNLSSSTILYGNKMLANELNK